MLELQIETPALILDLEVFHRNLDKANAYIAGSKMRMRPHYKSSKCTAIAHMQLSAGAKGITCSKLSEAEDLVFSGIDDVLIANQVTEPSKLARLASLAKCARITVCVDTPENISALERAAAAQYAVIHCLVEYDIGMHRCGVYTPEEFLALAGHIAACPHLVFEGIQAYAGNLAHEADAKARRRSSATVEARLRHLIDFLRANGVACKEVSGVSTGTLEFRPKDTVYTEVQAGSYIYMDMSYRNVGAPFENALFVLSTVISKSAGATVFDAGMKSLPIDQALPALASHPDITLGMSEEHCQATNERLSSIAIGQKLRIIPGHCCTTINQFNWLYLVRNGKVVDRLPVTGRGKSI